MMYSVLPQSRQNVALGILFHGVSISVYQLLFKNMYMLNRADRKNAKLPVKEGTHNSKLPGFYLAIIAVFALLTTGCKKFLDYQPKDKVPQAVLFNDEQGFKDALTGIYLAMDKPQNGGTYGLYTNNLSMGMASTLAYDYNNAT